MTESNIYTALSLMGVTKTRVVNGNVMCQCVLPSRHDRGDRKGSLSIKINDNGQSVVYCFGCHFRGQMVGLAYEFDKDCGSNIVQDVRKLEHNTYRPSFKDYDDVRHLRHRSDIGDLYLAKKHKLEEISEKDYKDCFSMVPRYIIESRGIDIDTCREWKIGYWNRGRKGVFFPVYDGEKRFVGYTIRWIFVKDDESPYLHMSGLKKSNVLYGENMINKKRSDKFVIVEGPIDALKVWAAGYNALSTLGGDFSDVQMSKILNLCKGMHGFAMGDGDKAGKLLASTIMEKLKGKKIDIKNVELDEGTDPGDLNSEQIKKKIEEVK